MAYRQYSPKDTPITRDTHHNARPTYDVLLLYSSSLKNNHPLIIVPPARNVTSIASLLVDENIVFPINQPDTWKVKKPMNMGNGFPLEIIITVPSRYFILLLPNVKATHPLPGAIFNEGVMG